MKVLLGVGGSDDSIRAAEQTVARAAVAGDELTVAVVENPSSDRSREEVTETVREMLDAEGVDAEIRHLDGDPGSRLVETAESEGFDQIVLGGGETSPMGKINIGSIAEFVLLNSHVTVSLVR
ncbi:Nucleotide-binding universal stress protein, UspA family [Halogeometricum rufum]|jgi:nucleotide-binding universal stress UspA family protein|uniref:Nucleotide-binding universal stress protein, UspA family n=1 Tax=Halogeometricum rufum TaxID=553469 RepID=A0A1I6JB21_9EURY|nr:MULTISPECIES: universal stress protein [Halogeometricum]MUV57019.1 universal stress protein [Halogeometricum sp. CBA1124]SFR76104.1 Nucleotide-binding universal stress protein, UspA family [Halogeometricum rufum]